MDNSKSYFENKVLVKNKVKRIFKKIEKYENYKNMIITNKHIFNNKEIAIELCNEYIQKQKNKAEKISRIYF